MFLYVCKAHACMCRRAHNVAKVVSMLLFFGAYLHMCASLPWSLRNAVSHAVNVICTMPRHITVVWAFPWKSHALSVHVFGCWACFKWIICVTVWVSVYLRLSCYYISQPNCTCYLRTDILSKITQPQDGCQPFQSLDSFFALHDDCVQKTREHALYTLTCTRT